MARKKKEEKNNNIDLGSWTCPVRWSDITLKQFQDIQRYYADKEKKVDVRDIVHILCGKTRDEVNLLPTEFLEKILEKLSFLSEEPVHQEPQSSIVIKGEKFVINIMEKLKAGEYIDTDTLIKQDKYNYAALFAILCRKEGEVYNDDFIANTLDDRIKMFEEQPVTNIFPLVSFFINCFLTLQKPFLLYSAVEEAINLTQKNIENSVNDGAISKFHMTLLKIRLSILKSYSKFILHHSLPIYVINVINLKWKKLRTVLWKITGNCIRMVFKLKYKVKKYLKKRLSHKKG